MRFFSDRFATRQTRGQELCARTAPSAAATRQPAFPRAWARLRKAFVLLWIPLALLGWATGANAQSSANGSVLYHGATYACYSCHGATPNMPQLNAANTVGVLNHIIANNFGGYMATFKSTAGGDATNGAIPLNSSDRADIAAYFQTVLTNSFPASTSVAYHGVTSDVPLMLDIGTTASTTPAPYTSVSYSAISNGTVAAGTPITYSGTGGTSGMSESTAAYTHTANNCSAGAFTATASGPAGTSSSRTVNVTITPPASPTASTAGPITAAFNSGTTVPVTLGGGPAASLSTVTGLSNGGSLTINGTTSYTYTSSSTVYSATDSFQYRANSPCAGAPGSVSPSSTVTVNINITAPTPTAPNFTTSVNYNPGGASATSISVAGPITNAVTGAVVIGSASHGTAVASGTNINYTPAAGNLTTATINYQTTGPGGTSTTGTITVNITAPGAPVVSSPNTVSVPYNYNATASATTIPLSSYITGVAGTVNIVGAPALGIAAANNPSSIDYTPASNNLTSTSLTYTITAPGGAVSNVATLNINITPPGAPTVNARAVSTPYNTPTTFDIATSITGALSNVTVPATGSQGGSVSIAGTNITYTPLSSFAGGTETFTYTAYAPPGSPTGNNATQTVTMTVIALPVVGNVTTTVPYQTATSIALPVTGATQINIVTPPTHGTAPTPAGGVMNVLYTPTALYTGTDSFTYTATGPGGTSGLSTVNITVNTLIPTGSAATMTVPINSVGSLDLAPFITGSSISGVSIATNPAHGSVSTSGTVVTYRPVNNFFGTDTFTYLSYGNGGTSVVPATVTVTVTGRPDPTQDPTVIALISSQVQTSRRITQTQTSNYHTRLEQLHQRSTETPQPGTGGATSTSFAGTGNNITAGNSTASSTTPAQVAARGYMPTQGAAAPSLPAPTGAAYRPAASLGSDPAAGLAPVPSGSPGTAVATLVAALSSNPNANPNDPSANVGKALAAVTSLAQTRTLNLSSSSNSGPTANGDIDIWAGGSVRFGSRDPGTANGASFSSDGVSMGVDKRINDKLAVGVGFGYSREKTDIGTDGSNSWARSYSVAGYASYQPTPNTFIDGVVGYGVLNFENDRYVVPINDYAHAKRSGDFIFASLAAGYELKTTGLLVSPYARLDLANHRLNAVTESGAGSYALYYASQRIPSVQLSLGLRAESAHETDFGYVAPRIRAEFQHDFKGEQQASISYADQIGGTSYLMPASTTSRNSLVLGVGGDFVFRHGTTLSLDYQRQRASVTDSSQAIYFKLTQALDGKGIKLPSYAAGAKPLGIHADFSYMLDDNVTRASTSNERLEDQSYSINFSKSFTFPLNDNMRLGVNTFGTADKFRYYGGLDRFAIGAEAELQYRASGEFGSPIYGVFANLTGEEFESNMRDGVRFSIGVSYRKPLTDRLNLFAAVAKNSRSAKSDAFSTQDYSGRVNVDYALAANKTLYLTQEYRRGDTVSTGLHSLGNINVAKVFARDDAFSRQGLYAYKVNAQTFVMTAGYNLAFGTQDSLDFSWRRAWAQSLTDSNLPTVGRPRYYANQFSIVYLTSF
jgi:uncharacterized protein with beta-barrel porin domain